MIVMILKLEAKRFVKLIILPQLQKQVLSHLKSTKGKILS